MRVKLKNIVTPAMHQIVLLDDDGRLWSGIMKFRYPGEPASPYHDITWQELPLPGPEFYEGLT